MTVDAEGGSERSFFGSLTRGYCVRGDGRDQNSGVKKLNSLDINTPDRMEKCLEACSKVSGVTGCEGIFSQGNRGCYAHTQDVSGAGNGRGRHNCWIKNDLPEEFGMIQRGYCVRADGRD
jgi:hypothetical protein